MGLLTLIVLLVIIYLIIVYLNKDKKSEFNERLYQRFLPKPNRTLRQNFTTNTGLPAYAKTGELQGVSLEPENKLINEFSKGTLNSAYDHNQYIYNANVTPNMVRQNDINRRKALKNKGSTPSVYETPQPKRYGPYNPVVQIYNNDNTQQVSGVSNDELVTSWSGVI